MKLFDIPHKKHSWSSIVFDSHEGEIDKSISPLNRKGDIVKIKIIEVIIIQEITNAFLRSLGKVCCSLFSKLILHFYIKKAIILLKE